ncbi:hypothetical protein BCR34DRAFT_589959 [Clohesyomyces aquaticus]|uniref:Uncharacterized protein n=1 Tax=Clohesyomyces aquaticus TaxID=1231657 RepID=A0A1Y1ZDU3_9PLEO|nr:hypothetical protein BCR34DRAFT_589959 [Clohesyomyces aquaticus]
MGGEARERSYRVSLPPTHGYETLPMAPHRREHQGNCRWKSRNGYKLSKWQPIEEAFLLLLHEKFKLAAAYNLPIQCPTNPIIMVIFNNFFVGKTIKNKKGKELEPRVARDVLSVRSRTGPKNPDLYELRQEGRALLMGRSGAFLYKPIITEEELAEYRSRKVIGDDPHDPQKNAALLAHSTSSDGEPSTSVEEIDVQL